MKLLRKLFFLEHIYFAHTPVTMLLQFIALPFSLVAFFLTRQATFGNYALYIFWNSFRWFLFLPLFYFLIRTIIRSLIVWRLTKGVALSPILHASRGIEVSSLSYELDGVDQVKLLQEGPDWKLYLAAFKFYRKTRSGTYLHKTAYYTVYETRLRRQVPHIVFDSKLAKGSQFRFLFMQSQRLSLEGNFDTYFNTYAPLHYHVDSLSFVSPEVMRIILEAKDYDTEMFNDSLFCYGPLMTVSEAADLRAKGEAIARHLNDNLDTYRDNHPLGQDRTQEVSMFARTLLKSPVKHVPSLLISGIGLAGLVYLSFKFSQNIWKYQLTWFLIISFFWSVYSVVKIIRDNRSKEAAFLKAMQFANENPQRTKPGVPAIFNQ